MFSACDGNFLSVSEAVSSCVSQALCQRNRETALPLVRHNLGPAASSGSVCRRLLPGALGTSARQQQLCPGQMRPPDRQPPSLQPQPTFSTSTCRGKPGRSTRRHSSAPPELLWVMKRKKIPPRAGETSIHTYVGLCSTSYPPSVVHLDVRLCICG